MVKDESKNQRKPAGGGAKSKHIGRPPMYKTPKLLQARIDEYFKTGMKSKTITVGVGTKQRTVILKTPTITGLTLFLGFSDRQSFRDYGNKSSFSCTIKRAHTRIEQEYEENLQANNVAGSIFALKNLGWKDKTEQLHSIADEDKELLCELAKNYGGLPGGR